MTAQPETATVVEWIGDRPRDPGPETPPELAELTAAEIGAAAHLYRGEVYRCSVWRTRLDTTTNWAVVTLGVALSISYAAPDASPLPLVLIGVLNLFFLMLEARRYRYCDVWRTRFRTMEKSFYAPMLDPRRTPPAQCWRQILAQEYVYPVFRISYLHALGRRIRRSYLWIMAIQILAFLGKIAVHPEPVSSLQDVLARAEVGLVPGVAVFAAGGLYVGTFCGLALYSAVKDRHIQRTENLPVPDAVY